MRHQRRNAFLFNACLLLTGAANAVKHAGGSALSVRISREKNGIRFVLENNGAASVESLRESGGLLSLRAFVGSRGGIREVERMPQVRITITLPLNTN